MGRLTLGSVLLTFAAGAGAAWLDAPRWLTALYLALTLVPLTALLAVGWIAQARLGSRWPPEAWGLLPAGAALGVVTLSALIGPGPGRLPPVGRVRIDLPGWSASAAGLAAAIVLVGFGVVAAASPRRGVAFGGAGAAILGVLAVQPALADLGLPTVGPLGIGVAAAAVALGRRLFPREPA